MRIAATADFHGRGFPDVPSCDLLLIAGDWSPVNQELHDWLARVPAGEVVAIAGNHDHVAQENEEAVRELPWTYLRDETAVVDGLTIHGSPMANKFFDWPFMAEEDELAEKHWRLIPDDVDVLMTHGPAYGYGDLVARGEHVGSKTLALRIATLADLKLHVCGHIHEDSGVRTDERGVLRANASFVNLAYTPAHPVLLFDYDGGRIVPVAGGEVIDRRRRARPRRERRERRE